MRSTWLERHDPIQERAALKWEQGIPLGNGKIGAMVWGGDGSKPLIISVDQAEIWDLHAYCPPANKTWTEYKQLLEQHRGAETDGFGYDPLKPHATRIPVGRLELFADGEILTNQSRLSLTKGVCEGTMTIASGKIPYAVWISACRQLMVVKCDDGALRPRWKFICRHGDYTQADSEEATAYSRFGHLQTMSDMVHFWGYPQFIESRQGAIECYRQDIPESGGFAVASVRIPGAWLISIQWSRKSAPDAEQMAVAAVKEGVEIGLDVLRREHEQWWEAYYETSYITIPDARLEGYYYLQMYMLACCTRPEGPHMTLCGPWTDDNNLQPICANDYHWNNEQQMQVWPVYTSNRIAYGDPMFDMIEDNLEVLKETCRLHFKTDGAFLAHSTDSYLRPTYMNVDNYELNPLPWICFHYWKRYLYTQDEAFLEKRAYPVMKLAVAPLLSELREAEDGYLHLPWTSSPEYHGENETNRWLNNEDPDWSNRFGPDATIDLALTRFLLKTLCTISEKLGRDVDLRREWQQTADRLAPYPRDPYGGYAVRADVNLSTSHRHMSHLFPIYPLEEVTMETDAKLINRCLDVIGMNGRGEWVGWTFPWVSIIYARAGRSAAARNLLLDFVDRYVTETGMHYQGPQGGCDVSLYGDAKGLFGLTIEAQLGVPEAIHELLTRPQGEKVRIFCDAPPAWAECAFTGLRTKGAFLLDAKRENYCTRFVRVHSEKGGTIRIDTDMGEGELHGPVRFEDGVYVADMHPGETIVFWRGDKPNTQFVPEALTEKENHFWGVKRVHRF